VCDGKRILGALAGKACELELVGIVSQDSRRLARPIEHVDEHIEGVAT